MSDELFELRNYFYLGNFSAATTEGETVEADNEKDRIERDVIMARIQIARKEYSKVLNSITPDSSVAMQAVALLAKYHSDPTTNKDGYVEVLSKMLEDDVSKENPTVLTIGTIVYAESEDYDNALRTAQKGNEFEHMALKVQILIKMDRVDAAKEVVTVMREIDEDNTLTQLAAAWTYVAEGGKDVEEALSIYQDLLERHGATDPILNGMATCHLSLGQYDEADRVLQEALAKDQNVAATLINSVVCAKYRNKHSELVQRYLNQLRTVAPEEPWLKDIDAKSTELDRIASAF